MENQDNTDNLINRFTDSGDITYQQILNNLLDGSKDLELKTHIAKPKELAALMTLAHLLKELEYKESCKTIEEFIEKFLRYMVSYNRESRKEIIKAIAPVINTEKEYNTNIPTSLD